jgi:hypothetical protein
MIFRAVAAVALAFAALILWREIYTHHCIALTIPAMVALIITINIREHAAKRKQHLAALYFRQASMMYRLFCGRVRVNVIALATSVITGTALMGSLLTWDTSILAALAIDAAILPFVLMFLLRKCEAATNEGVNHLVAKMLTSAINTFILVAALLLIQLHSSFPSYLDRSILKSVENASEAVGSQCETIDRFAKLQSAKEAIGWWLMAEGNKQLGDARARWVAWCLFLLNGTLSIVAYSLYMTQVAYFAMWGYGNAVLRGEEIERELENQP